MTCGIRFIGQRSPEPVNNEMAYHALKGTTRPVDGFPARVTVVTRWCKFLRTIYIVCWENPYLVPKDQQSSNELKLLSVDGLTALLKRRS